LADACRNDRYVGGAAVSEVTGKNTRVVGKNFCIPQIVDVAFGTSRITIDQNNLGRPAYQTSAMHRPW